MTRGPKLILMTQPCRENRYGRSTYLSGPNNHPIFSSLGDIVWIGLPLRVKADIVVPGQIRGLSEISHQSGGDILIIRDDVGFRFSCFLENIARVALA
jgi:hypothetical protein